MMEEEDEDVLFDQTDLGGDEFGGDEVALLSPDNRQSSSSTQKYTKQVPLSRCFKYYSTFCLSAAFFGLGLCISIPGPTLLDLQQQTGTDTETISRLFTGRSVGYLLGSVVSGVLFDRLNQPCLISFSLLLTAVGTVIAPWCRSFHWLVVVVAFQGLSMGFLDTGGNVMCVQIWGEDNGPWMQTLHFSFGIGAFVAPLLAEPFLSKNNHTNTTVFALDDTITDIDVTSLPELQPPSEVQERSVMQDDDAWLMLGSGIGKPNLHHLQKRDTAPGQQQQSKWSESSDPSQHSDVSHNNGEKSYINSVVRRRARLFSGSSFVLEKDMQQELEKLFRSYFDQLAAKEAEKKPTSLSPTKATTQVTKASALMNNRKDTDRTQNKGPDLDTSKNYNKRPIGGKRPRPQKRINVPQNFGIDVDVNKARNPPSEDASGRGKSNKRPRPPDNRGNVPPGFGVSKEKENKEGAPLAVDPQNPTNRSVGSGRSRPRPSGGNIPSNFGPDRETGQGEEDADSNGGSGGGGSAADARGRPARPRPQRPGSIPSWFGVPRNRKGKRDSEGTSTKSSTGMSNLTGEDDVEDEGDIDDDSGKRKTRSVSRGHQQENIAMISSKMKQLGSHSKSRKKRQGTESNKPLTTTTNFSSPVGAGTDSSKLTTGNGTSTTTSPIPKKPKVLSSDNKNGDVASGKILKVLDKHVDHPEEEGGKPGDSEEVTEAPDPKAVDTVNGTGKSPPVNQTHSSILKAVTSSTPVTQSIITIMVTTPTTTQSTTPTLAKTAALVTSTVATPSDTVNNSKESTTSMNTSVPLNSTKHSDAAKNDSGVLQTIKDDLNYVFVTVEQTVAGLTTVQFAYLIIACYVLIVSFLFMTMCCRTRCTLTAIKMSSSVSVKSGKSHQSTGFKIQLLILLFIFFFLYVGMEITVGGLLLTFSVEYLNWSKSAGTLLTSVFWGSFAAARGLAIPFAKCLSPPIMLILDLVLTNLALLALLVSLDSNPTMVWYCTVVLGVGMASIFPTGVTWAERYIDLTSRATAVFVVGSSLGEMCVPALTGFMFEQKGPMWLIYIIFGMAVLSIVIYIIMQNLASNSGVKYTKVSKLRDTTLTELDDADLEMDSIPLTPDLDISSESHTTGGYFEQNGSVSKSRKKVTFNLKDESRQENAGLTNKARGSILKGKGMAKTS